ncbi:MCAT [Symbiodinium sp. CCMP2592]|nr:MCAT [Symbiodinium sp. CCMP2592]
MTWNAGGLSSNVYQELLTFIRDAKMDICLVQETKWAEDNCWSTVDYHFIHSAGKNKLDKVGGLLSIVSAHLVKKDDLQYLGVHPGRLLHVRVQAGKVPLDILNVYQFAANEKPETTEHRHRFLLCLQRCVSGLPRRHALIMSGDFNSSCSPVPKVCGPHVLPVVDNHKADYMELLHLCEAQALVILNTWTAPTSTHSLATFTFGKLKSQIDFVMVRQNMATAGAKKAGVIHNFPVASWREGANHHAVEALIPMPRPHWMSKPKAAMVPPIDIKQMIADLRSKAGTPALEALRTEVACTLTPDLTDMDKVVMRMAAKHYPQPEKPQQPPTQPEELANSARHMWQLHKRMKAQPYTARGIVEAWKLWTQFSRAHRIHKQRAKVRSKVRRDELLEQAEQAAEKGNAHEMWSVVKRLAPKSRPKKVQLYRHGQIMTPGAELDWIVEEFGKPYGATSSTEPGSLLRQHEPVQLQEDYVLEELRKIPVRKAVPPGAVPAVVWRACAEQLVGPLVRKVSDDWQAPQVRIHQDWAQADVALLPKGKPNANTPLDLRPIGLQHPVGKTSMKVVLSMAKADMIDMVRKWPQTAYLPGRSTTTALKTVFAHCDAVRKKCSQTRQSLHDKHEGKTAPSFSGGLQVSLDLTAAFDLVGWQYIKDAMELAHINASVQELLLQWLRQVVYVFHHGRDSKSIRPQWGLRQGCIASPMLWGIFTALLCQAFDVRLKQCWSTDHAGLYADDSHLRWQFSTFTGMEQAVSELRLVLKIFSRFGMKVNEKKTQALLMVAGTDKGKVHKHYVRSGNEGKRLLLSPKDPTKWLPLVTQANYLGLIIAYDRFEALSTRHRIAKANQRRWVLAPVLHSRKLAVRYKLQIYRSCVQSSLLYGLHSFGLTPKLMNEVQATAMKHLRAVVSDPRHITGRTHQEVRDTYHLEDVGTLIKRAHDRETNGEEPDWMHLPEWDAHVTSCLQDAAATASGKEEDSEPEHWACPECDSFFGTAAALKIHAYRAHGIHNKPLRIFDKARHAVKGLPTYRFCEKRFARWQTLEHHINNLACPLMHAENKFSVDGDTIEAVRLSQVHASAMDEHDEQNADSAEPERVERIEETIEQSPVKPLAQQLLVQQTANQGLRFFIQQPSITRQLHQHCGLCGQWVASHKVMKLHYRNNHPEILPARQQDIVRTIELSATPSIRCHYCNEMDEFFGAVRMGQDPAQTVHGDNDSGMNPKRRREAPNHSGWGQEQEINLLKQDTSLVLWFSPGGDSILNHLYRTAVEFKKKQAAEPTWGMAHMPLKQVMALSMFRELKDRHAKVLASQELTKRATDMGWRDTQGWHFQQWNPKLKHLELDKQRSAIPDIEMANKLENKHAEEIWDLLIELQGCCKFQLIGLGRIYMNPANACYMNASVQVLEWMLYVMGQNVDATGTGAAFFTSNAMNTQCITLMQVQEWRDLVIGWAEVHRQHDVGEFLGYVLPGMNMLSFQGTWQAFDIRHMC